jgi:hypothetical protein
MLRKLLPDAVVDPLGGMSLFARRLQIGFQDRVNERL